MFSRKDTIACFGATGGCVGATLACALKEGHYCTALARTPDKLRSFLVEKHNVSPKTLDQYLTIHQGDAKDPAAVAKPLISPTDATVLVDIILSGIGAYPTFQWSIRTPFPLTDPTICESGAAALFTALSNLSSPSSPSPSPSLSAKQAPITSTRTGRKPLFISISTAAARTRGRGVPLSIYLPYIYLLSSPLADKRRMEALILADRGAHVRDFVLMRPPFLTDGEESVDRDGVIKVGWEWGVEVQEADDGEDKREIAPGPRIGWTMSRKDLGAWVFEKVVVKGGWEGRCVTLAY